MKRYLAMWPKLETGKDICPKIQETLWAAKVSRDGNFFLFEYYWKLGIFWEEEPFTIMKSTEPSAGYLLQ